MEETSLLDGLIAGNRQVFSTLFDLYWEELYSYVARLVGDKEESIDIVQDTFASLWEQREQLVVVKSLRGYIFAMVHHKAMRFIKNSIRYRNYIDSMEAYFSSYKFSMEDEIAARELADFIKKEIDNLPPRMREIFLLSREERLSYKEIALKLSIAENTVRKQISFSIKYLRMRIGKAYPSSYVPLLVLTKWFLS